MNKFSPLQLIIMIIAGFGLIVAVLLFSFSRSENGGSSDIAITVWGTLDDEIISTVVANLASKDVNLNNVTYVEKDEATLEEDFVRALAEGSGPDIVMLNQKQVIENEKKLMLIPFTTISVRDYLDTYVPEAELFIRSDGIIGIPFMLDPMVMYWNRTLFANAGIATPPRFWTEVMEITPRLTVSNSEHFVEESAIALGEFRNIDHAKEIFLNLLLQAGNNVVVQNVTTDGGVPNGYKVTLSDRLGFTIAPAVASLNFFTQFSNPARDVYSWNRSLPSSLNQFLAGDLAMYLGFASEVDDIRSKNPNLDFDMTTMPQSSNSSDRKVFGNMTILSIARNSKNPVEAYRIISLLSSPDFLSAFNEVLGLPPVRRDMLLADPSDPTQSILFTSALWSRGVLEIDSKETNNILQNMLESFTTGQFGSDQALQRAQEEMELLLRK